MDEVKTTKLAVTKRVCHIIKEAEKLGQEKTGQLKEGGELRKLDVEICGIVSLTTEQGAMKRNLKRKI